MGQNHAAEITQGKRFEFGANWAHFLNVLDENRIDHGGDLAQGYAWRQ